MKKTFVETALVVGSLLLSASLFGMRRLVRRKS